MKAWSGWGRTRGRHTYLYNGVVQVLLNWAGTVALWPEEKRKMKQQTHRPHESRDGP